MPKKKSKSKEYQGRIYCFVPEDDDGVDFNLSLLIEPALIIHLAKLIEEGEVELTDKGQLKFGGKLYESDYEDSSYDFSGMLWSKDVDQDEWPDIKADYDLEEEEERPTKRKSKAAPSTKRRTGASRKYR